jgi:hypothetical protein
VEGILDLASLQPSGSAGVLVRYSQEEGMRILMDGRGVCYLDQVHTGNGAIQHHFYNVDREIPPKEKVGFRLVLQHQTL